MKTKTIILFILVLGVVTLGFFAVQNKTQYKGKEEVKNEDIVVPVVSNIPTSGMQCFSRIQKATDTAPYNVEEYVVLNFDGIKITGTKRGTQAGPDMTNGYTGTLEGAKIINENIEEIELTYSYVVEGSKNRELEVYTLDKNNLIKKRWLLVDRKINGVSILVPDYVGEPSLISYSSTECKN
jgi:hypothetical protein